MLNITKRERKSIRFNFCKRNIICFAIFVLFIAVIFCFQWFHRSQDESMAAFLILPVQLVFFYQLAFMRIRPTASRNTSLIMALVIVAADILFIEYVTEVIGISGVAPSPGARILSCLLILFIQLVILGISGSLFISIISSNLILVIYVLANYFVMKYRGDPIVPTDIFSVGTLNTVVSTYKITFTSMQISWMIWMVCFFFLCFRLKNWNLLPSLGKSWKNRKRILIRTVGVIIGAVGIFTLTNADLLERAGISGSGWDRKGAYCSNGPLMNFMINIQNVSIHRPEGYSKEKAEQILSQFGDDGAAEQPKPNIIMIMNESLADFWQREGSDIALSSDPLSFIHGLNDNTIKGNCYVSIFGSGTANSELEALTGHSMAFFPSGTIVYQLFPQDVTKGLPGDLKANGYDCTAIHPFTAGNWNRDIIYESMGFDRFLSIDDFDDPEYVRWVSDQATYDKIIELYENRESDKPMFVFDVTMQGHGGYDTQTDWESPVTVSGEEYPLANEYLSSTYVSDKAFQNLIEYFEKQDEPTVILMFGDHQPSVEQEFYNKLLGKSEDLDLEDIQKKYITPYILWANYDIQEENKDISANRLGLMVKQTSGLPLTPYEQFIRKFSEEIPVINANGFRDKNGKWYTYEDESPYQELIRQYEIVQYSIYCDHE